MLRLWSKLLILGLSVTLVSCNAISWEELIGEAFTPAPTENTYAEAQTIPSNALEEDNSFSNLMVQLFPQNSPDLNKLEVTKPVVPVVTDNDGCDQYIVDPKDDNSLDSIVKQAFLPERCANNSSNFNADTIINQTSKQRTDRIVTPTATGQTSSPDKKLSPVREKACGHRNTDGVVTRIAGIAQEEATFGEFPWMVVVIEKKEVNMYKCGGSLIHQSVVLTGAKCVVGLTPASLLVRAGEWNSLNENESHMAENRDIVEIIVHENFNKLSNINAVALIITASPFPLNVPTIGAVCLPPPNHVFDGAECVVSGWGKNESGISGRYSNILKKIELPVISNSNCENKLRKSILGSRFILHPTFLCAGEPGKDACTGDGGSPLVCPIDGDRYYQAGTVSWGIECGVYPGVYANIPVLKDWIDKQMTDKGFGTASYTYKAT